MHYRNGREAKNGDKIVLLRGGTIQEMGVLYDAMPGNDQCNGSVAPIHAFHATPCLCDCLHVDDVASLLAEKGLEKRPEGM